MRSALIRAREARGKTQEQVALEAEISRSFYAHIETGSRSCSLDVALRIARVLGVGVEEIFLPKDVSGRHNHVRNEQTAAAGE